MAPQNAPSAVPVYAKRRRGTKIVGWLKGRGRILIRSRDGEGGRGEKERGEEGGKNIDLSCHMKFIEKGGDYSSDMLKFIKQCSDFCRVVLQFMGKVVIIARRC